MCRYLNSSASEKWCLHCAAAFKMCVAPIFWSRVWNIYVWVRINTLLHVHMFATHFESVVTWHSRVTLLLAWDSAPIRVNGARWIEDAVVESILVTILVFLCKKVHRVHSETLWWMRQKTDLRTAILATIHYKSCSASLMSCCRRLDILDFI